MNSRELDYGDRIGYRGQMQYNEPYGDSHPQIMDNPQPLATLSHRNDGLQRGFQQDGKFEIFFKITTLFQICVETLTESMQTLTAAISALFRAIKLSDIAMDSKATTIQTYSILKISNM